MAFILYQETAGPMPGHTELTRLTIVGFVALCVLAWLAKNPATFGQHFPEIRWDSARSQGTVLLSVVWWS